MKITAATAAVAFAAALTGGAWLVPDCQAQPAAAAPGPVKTGSAALASPDLDETVRWYGENLGFRVLGTRATVQGRKVVLERRGLLLEFAEADRPERPMIPADVETTGAVHNPALSLIVADVDGETERLRARGVVVLHEPDDELDGRFRTSWVRDNEGRIIELREPLAEPSGEQP